jgi:N-acetylmuramoyl-L-alanine amidase
MQASVVKKVSELMAVLLVISLLSPVMALADAYFKDIRYTSNGTVTGQVYFNGTVGDAVYGEGNSVTLSVYDRSGNYVTPITATYSSYTNGNYYYTFTPVTTSTTYSAYNPITIRYHHDGLNYTAVTDAVYKEALPDPTPGSGGGTYYPPTTPSNPDPVDEDQHVIVDGDDLEEAFHGSAEVTVTFGESVTIPVSALVDAAKRDGTKLKLSGDLGTYELPLSVLDLNELTRMLETGVTNLTLSLRITALTGDEAAAVNEAVADAGGTALSAPVSFSLQVQGNDGKKLSLDSFDGTYVKRTIKLDKSTSGNATVTQYIPQTGSLNFVPSTVSGMTATFQRPGNSVYVVIENNPSFSDLTGHWAKADIELMAGKLLNGKRLVDGTGSSLFEPDRSITRAEFAELAVKALGLNVPRVTAVGAFSDVNPDAWHAVYIESAKQAGLLEGYEDGTFRPDRLINREELFGLAYRTLKYAGVDTEVDPSRLASALTGYGDALDLVWARHETSTVLVLGVTQGTSAITLEPSAKATRAEATVLLKRILTRAGFIQ